MSHYFVSPADQYAKRLTERELQLARLDALHARVGAVRLAIGAAVAASVWLCIGPIGIAPAWMLVPIAAFVATLVYHSGVRSRRLRAQRGAALYREGIERITDRWQGKGHSGAQFEVLHHVYGADLDLFGPGGLYELLCAARTPMGEARLARWLLRPAALTEIIERHAAIGDLRDRLDFREDLAAQGDSARIELRSETLAGWATSPNRLDDGWLRWAAPLLAVLAFAGCIAWAAWGLRFPLLAVVAVEITVSYALKARIREVIAGIETAYEGLKELAALLSRVEGEPFTSAALRGLVVKLSASGVSASDTLSRLATIVNFVESRRNPLLAPLLLLIMYRLQAALAAERWRASHGAQVSAWLDVVGDLEALVSLARYHFEHPDDVLPEFVAGPAAFEAIGLGHPLIAAAGRVCNDVVLAGTTRVLLVSGSNMSGKSTLMRSIGVNTVLAMAGAPVCARRLRLTPLQVGASIRVNDSLNEGSSRFYAEITRLRQLFEAFPLPLLFLLDELLQRTNSADRRVGAEGVIKALVDRGAIGLISTHDLALTEISGLQPGALVNVHFQDEFVDGRLKFDFKLHPGIVTKSNGVELMRSIGLDV